MRRCLEDVTWSCNGVGSAFCWLVGGSTNSCTLQACASVHIANCSRWEKQYVMPWQPTLKVPVSLIALDFCKSIANRHNMLDHQHQPLKESQTCTAITHTYAYHKDLPTRPSWQTAPLRSGCGPSSCGSLCKIWHLVSMDHDVRRSLYGYVYLGTLYWMYKNAKL